MKPTFYFILLTVLFSCLSCQSGFRISGTAPLDNPITFDHLVNSELQTIGTTTPSNGKFTYRHKRLDSAEIYFLSTMLNDKQTVGHFFIAEKGNAHISIDTTGDVRVQGTKLNNLLQNYHDQRKSILTPFNQLYYAHQKRRAKANPSSQEETERLQKESDTLDSYEKKIQELDLQFTKNNINNPAGQLSLNNFVLYSPSIGQLKEIINAASEQTKQTRSIQNIVKQIEDIERSFVGQPFVDVELNLPSGKNIFIADYANKGKYTLLYIYIPGYFMDSDFLLLKNLYEQYGGKNLELLTIALDRKKDKWLNILSKYDMQWAQLIDISGASGDMATAYNLNTFPYFILLDENGIILLRNSKSDTLKDVL